MSSLTCICSHTAFNTLCTNTLSTFDESALHARVKETMNVYSEHLILKGCDSENAKNNTSKESFDAESRT